MIRAIRPNAAAQDDASLISGWNLAPNIAYTITLVPGAVSCAVLLYDEDGDTLIASGAALAGTEQPCTLRPQTGQTVSMVDDALGWHLLLTTTGTESQRTVRIGPMVDLPDEIHPVYGGDDDMALARATAAIDEGAHYRDDVTVTCPLGLGAGLGDTVSVPVGDETVTGQVESITWTATPDGASSDLAVIRRHVAIAPDAFVEPPTPPALTDDMASTDADTEASGNVLDNDDTGLTVVAVNGLSSGVGSAVAGSAGGLFTIAADGSWAFTPNGDFEDLHDDMTSTTSALYHATDGASEASATITVTVTAVKMSPVAVDDAGATTADANTSGNVLANDTDANSDSLTVSQVAGSTSNVGAAVAGSSGGLFTINSDGSWIFTPNGDFGALSGEDTATTSVTYHVSDGELDDQGTLTVTVSAPIVTGITLVAETTINLGVLNGSQTTTIPGDVQPGDLVLIALATCDISDRSMGVYTSGYTEIWEAYVNDQKDLNLSVSYKVLESPVDTEVVHTSLFQSYYYPGRGIIQVFRGVDPTTPLDVTATTAASANSNTPNPPAITPATSGARIVSVAASGMEGNVAQSISAPGDLEDMSSVYVSGEYGWYALGLAMASMEWDGSGTIDLPSWSGFNSSNTSNSTWAALTIALRPAS